MPSSKEMPNDCDKHKLPTTGNSNMAAQFKWLYLLPVVILCRNHLGTQLVMREKPRCMHGHLEFRCYV